jgi:hypothetical protein
MGCLLPADGEVEQLGQLGNMVLVISMPQSGLPLDEGGIRTRRILP